MIDIALKYHDLGFSVTPASQDKSPIGLWKQKQQERIQPDETFLIAERIGIIAGKVSGGLEVIDFDLKFDLTSTLFEDYKDIVSKQDPNLLSKMVVQKSRSGGYHFFYRCSVIEGNQKLATRIATESEIAANPKEKVKSIIETRGEGGFIMTAPSAGYEWFYKDLTQISMITPEERAILISSARFFNEVFVEQKHKKEYVASHTVFDEWNQRGDIEAILEEEGWTYKGMCRGNRMYLRPGSEHKWSAGYHPDTHLFRVFTTNSDFENDKTYNPSQVLAFLKFNKDYSATAKWLETNGYGVPKQQFSEVNLDNEFDFVCTDEEIDKYITQIRNGTFEMGKSTGFKSLDKHFVFKPNTLVLMLGHDNVGKSVIGWFLACQSAKLHNWRWIIWAGENKAGGVKKRICEFYYVKKITDITQVELDKFNIWFKKHFTLIRNNKLYTYTDMLNIGRKLSEKSKYDAFMIDPYNGLYKDTENEHMYDYQAMLEFLQFREQVCSIFLCVHAVTEALRRRYPKGHNYEGHAMPPHKADTEGGGKFSNKADDFMIIHRMAQHREEWMISEIHIQKIKEAETGGKQTVLDEPVKLRMMRGSVGFEEVEPETPLHLRDFTEPNSLTESQDTPF